MALTIQSRRGTQAGLTTQAGASNLNEGELFLVTDTAKVGVGLTDSTYALCAMDADIVWTKTGTVLSPKTAGDKVEVTLDNAGGQSAIKATTTGTQVAMVAVEGVATSLLGTGVKGSGVYGGQFAGSIAAGTFDGTGADGVIILKTGSYLPTNFALTTRVSNVPGVTSSIATKHTILPATTRDVGFGIKEQIDLTGAVTYESLTALTAATTAKREIWLLKAGTLTNVHTIEGSGQHKFGEYGAGSFSGTVAKLLAVTSDGDVIETDEPDTSNWTRTGTSLSPKVANDIVEVTTNVALANAVKGVNSVGVGVYGEGLNGVKGVATGSGVGVAGEATEGTGVVSTNTRRDNATLTAIKTTTEDSDNIGQMLLLRRRTGQNAGEGLGGSILWQINDTNGDGLDAGQIDVKWTGVGTSSQMDVYLRRNGTYERKMALLHTGQAVLDQYGLGSFPGTVAKMLAVTSTGEVIETDSTGGATTALDNLTSVAINTSLISDTDSTDDLGSAAKCWKDTYTDKVYTDAVYLKDDAGAGTDYSTRFQERASTINKRIMLIGEPQSNTFGFVIAPTNTTGSTTAVIALWNGDVDSGYDPDFGSIQFTANGDLDFNNSISANGITAGKTGDIIFKTRATTYLKLSHKDENVTFPNGNVGMGTETPNANAILDVASTTKAFMPPRMTTAQRDAIPSPTAGMVIYNTTTNVLNFHNGTTWGAV